ncbi:hypothetical protein KKF84_22690, partial [Myxococcota bacterium]|nr:hypothetical protein [Myxococcota bacterium]MBU1538137.1 hypothetical protein [Myxococcota bacterium]
TGALGGMVKSLSGNIDMADGISFHAVASLVREKDAQMAVTSFEQAKNMPGLGDLVKKISLSRSGTTLTTGGSISREDIENLKNNPMLGALMRK